MMKRPLMLLPLLVGFLALTAAMVSSEGHRIGRLEKELGLTTAHCLARPPALPHEHAFLYNDTHKVQSLLCAVITAPPATHSRVAVVSAMTNMERKKEKGHFAGFVATLGHSPLANLTRSLVFLESGTDPYGDNGCLFAKTFPDDIYIGVNCLSIKFPESVECRAPNAWFIGIDCSTSRLPLPSELVDFVVGEYIVEHISKESYFSELHRVSQPVGEGFMVWGPPWASRKGHHLFPSMARKWAGGLNTTTTYNNDGTAVPDWGHLYLSKAEMRKNMLQHRDQFPGPAGPELIETMLEYTYDSPRLGRIPYSKQRELVQKYFTIETEKTVKFDLPDSDIREWLERHWGEQDLQVAWVRWHLRKKQGLAPK